MDVVLSRKYTVEKIVKKYNNLKWKTYVYKERKNRYKREKYKMKTGK